MTDRELAALLDYATDQGWTVYTDRVGCTRLVKEDAPTYTINDKSELREGAARQVWRRTVQYGDLLPPALTERLYFVMEKHGLNASEITEVCRWTGIDRPPNVAPRVRGDQGTVKVDVVPAPLPTISDTGTTYPVDASGPWERVGIMPYVPPFHSEWVLADAAFVGALIARGRNFRDPSDNRVHQYAKLMTEGRWAWEMEPWCVASDGSFIQGNHRAHAAERYLTGGGTPQWIEVRYDCPTEWGQLMDGGQNRTHHQRVTALGHGNASKIASAAVIMSHLADHGGISGQALPGDEMSRLLGTGEAPTRLHDLIVDGCNLASRVRHPLEGTTEQAGFHPSPLAAVFTLWLDENDDRARTEIEFLIRANQWEPRSEGVGMVALSAFLRLPRHIRFADPSRYQKQQRTMLAAMMAWANPVITLGALKSRLIHMRDDAAMSDKTLTQWVAWKDELQTRAMKLVVETLP